MVTVNGIHITLRCDCCDETTDKLYKVDSDELCVDCVLGLYDRIDEDSVWESMEEGW